MYIQDTQKRFINIILDGRRDGFQGNSDSMASIIMPERTRPRSDT